MRGFTNQTISEAPAYSGVYVITCSGNGKAYVGSAVNIRVRWGKHARALARGDHHNTKLQRAWGKYGQESFQFAVILRCAKDNLIAYEQLALDTYDSVRAGFNIAPRAGSQLGLKHSAETRLRISSAQIGKKLTDEHKAKISLASKGHVCTAETRAKIARSQIGKVIPDDTRARMSEGQRGRRATDETRAKMSAARVGKKHSVETKIRMSAARTGLAVSPLTRAKLSASHLGKRPSQETRAKMSASQTGRKHSDETRAKISDAAKARCALRRAKADRGTLQGDHSA